MAGTKGKIVVGVDGSEGSYGALRWGWKEARALGLQLEVVSSWVYPPLSMLPGPQEPPLPHDLNAAAARTVTDMVTRVEAEEGSGVTSRTVVAPGPAARVLIDRSRDAEMLVVGARGLGRLHRLLLGSVSQECVQNAPCPVVVVPAHDRAAA